MLTLSTFFDILRPVLKLAVFLRCQLNPILNPSDTLNSKFPYMKNGQIIISNDKIYREKDHLVFSNEHPNEVAKK